MGRIGIGHGGRGSARLIAPLAAAAGNAVVPAKLSPSAQWNGTAGSGFTVVPTDPVRTTAKPIMRLLDPPNQYFTDELTISVMAFAVDDDTLNGGIDRVRFHFEQTTVDVLAPSPRQFTRYDGSTYSLPCYTVRLKKPGGAAGTANLYIEAIPADATMQRRVLGPIQFSPVAAKHAWDRTIGLTGSGADFTGATLAIATVNALNAARLASAQNPRVTYISSGSSDLAAMAAVYTAQGYMTFECAPGVDVTFAKASYTTDAAMIMRPRWDGLWFKGAGFTFDMAVASEIYHETQVSNAFVAGRSHVFEGVRFTRSTPLGALIRKGLPGGGVPYSVRGSPWMLECDIRSIDTPGAGANLYRGCILAGGYGDVLPPLGIACAVGNRVDGWTSETYRKPINAMTVQYTGTGATATLSLSGLNSTNNRTFTARVDGASVGTFTVLNTEAASIAGTNYNVSNVVAWINSLPGWTATLQNDTRLAAVLNNGVAPYGAFTNLNVKNVTLQLSANWDTHTDFFQTGTLNNNVLIYGNSGHEMDAAILAMGGTDTFDFAIVNNAFDIKGDSFENANGEVFVSQFSGAHRHVVFAHNSFARQGLWLRSDFTGSGRYNPDTYCLVATNSIRALVWGSVPNADADMTIKDNHLHGSGFGVSGTGSPGEVMSGNHTTLYVNAVAGDFTPAGALATNLKTPVWRVDNRGKARAATASPGAIG
jgi:hypothetical protein